MCNPCMQNSNNLSSANVPSQQPAYVIAIRLFRNLVKKCCVLHAFYDMDSVFKTHVPDSAKDPAVIVETSLTQMKSGAAVVVS